MNSGQANVEAISIQRNEEEVNTAYSGDNIRVKLKGVEEEVCGDIYRSLWQSGQ